MPLYQEGQQKIRVYYWCSCYRGILCFVLQDSAKAALDEVTRTLWCLKEETNQNYIPLTSHQEALNRVKDEEERVCHVPEQLFMSLSSTSTS